MALTLNTPSQPCSSRTYLQTHVISGQPQRGASHVPTTQMAVLGTTWCFITSSSSSSHLPTLLDSPKTTEEASLAKIFWKPPKLPVLGVPEEHWEQEGRRVISSQFCTTSFYLSPKQLCLHPESPPPKSLPHAQNLIKPFC